MTFDDEFRRQIGNPPQPMRGGINYREVDTYFRRYLTEFFPVDLPDSIKKLRAKQAKGNGNAA